MEITLDELIKIAGAALEEEDRYILGCSKATGSMVAFFVSPMRDIINF